MEIILRELNGPVGCCHFWSVNAGLLFQTAINSPLKNPDNNVGWPSVLKFIWLSTTSALRKKIRSSWLFLNLNVLHFGLETLRWSCLSDIKAFNIDPLLDGLTSYMLYYSTGVPVSFFQFALNYWFFLY